MDFICWVCLRGRDCVALGVGRNAPKSKHVCVTPPSHGTTPSWVQKHPRCSQSLALRIYSSGTTFLTGIPKAVRVLTSKSGPGGGQTEPSSPVRSAPGWPICKVSGQARPWRGVGHTPHPGLEQCFPTFLCHRTQKIIFLWHSGRKGGTTQCQDQDPEGTPGPWGGTASIPVCSHCGGWGVLSRRCTWPQDADVTDAGLLFGTHRLPLTASSRSSPPPLMPLLSPKASPIS